MNHLSEIKFRNSVKNFLLSWVLFIITSLLLFWLLPTIELFNWNLDYFITFSRNDAGKNLFWLSFTLENTHFRFSWHLDLLGRNMKKRFQKGNEKIPRASDKLWLNFQKNITWWRRGYGYLPVSHSNKNLLNQSKWDQKKQN